MPVIDRILPGLVCATFALSAAAQADQQIETVVVTAAPLPGSAIDPDKLPGETETIPLNEATRDRATDVLPNVIATQLSSVTIEDEQGSQFQPDFAYRGFEASPVSGVAEGIAVYQDGVRLNESFGDNLNWDLIPVFAVDTFTLQSDNPAFGLNALGGAVSLGMKSGLTFDGTQAEMSGGSFGNLTGDIQYGARLGKFAVYAGFGALSDDGFRYRSQTALRQGYGDLAYEDGPLTLHLSLGGALNRLGAAGPTPVQLLAADPRAVFTLPQTMENESALAQFRGTWKANGALTLSFNAYWRRFHQNLADGNTTDVVDCKNDSAWLCLGGAGEFPNDVLYNANGNPVPASVLPIGATPGEIDFTRTETNTFGLAGQLAWDFAFAGHANNLVVGAALDRGNTDYTAHGELGTLLESLNVAGSGVIIDESHNPNASPPIETPVHVDGRNTYGGLYALDVLDITPALSWTVSGRLNTAGIALQDLRGAALSGTHSFLHFNPGSGFTYKLGPELTAYAGYSESNRAPTPGELSCAAPATPCILGAFLAADPQLKQVTARTYEFGLRGRFTVPSLEGEFAWMASAYRTDAVNDIRLLATAINGFGYFSNAGTTRHQGIDAHLDYHVARWRVSAGYSYLDATFRDALTLSSNSPAADAGGVIFVRPGDAIPLDPAHRATVSADFDLTKQWSLGAGLRMQSGIYLAGDESNQEPKLPGFVTTSLRSAYAIARRFTLFGEIENLLDNRYDTYGAFTGLEGLPPKIHLTNPRTYSPAPGRLFFGGIRAAL